MFVLLVVFLFIHVASFAQLRLPKLMSNGMVLQRNTALRIWGWDTAGEKISLRFNQKTYKTQTDAKGYWQVTLPAMPAGGPFEMDIADRHTKLTIKDILIGEVWLCSGQSNMVHQLNIHDVTYAKDIAEANNTFIRQFLVPINASLQAPQEDLTGGQWKAAVQEEVRPFSAVAYFFAQKIYEQYHVPVGIINASVGGTPIEAWTSEEGLQAFPAMQTLIRQNKDTAYVNSTNRKNAAYLRNLPQPNDQGLNQRWFEPNYQAKNWRTIAIPGYWEDQGIRDLNGIVWYRKEINIPASMVGKPAKVFLGRIVDADELYINGKKIGNTAYQYPQRRYTVANDVLKEGKNLFVVRVTNTAGKGGFVPDKPYCIFAEKDTVDLKGYWQYKVGAVFQKSTEMPPPAINAAMQPTGLYNGMIAHANKYAIKGVCWYQGESNASQPKQYAQYLPTLINDWRKQWQNETLPFLYVQLPNFMEYDYSPSESNWAVLRESQAKALGIPQTAMVVAIDLGEWNDIHPDNKKSVGERLALAARKIAYHENLVHTGPLFESATVEGNKLVLQFSNIGGGLISKDGEALSEFAIAGKDKKFVWAKAMIQDNKVLVWSDAISNPVYVRYAWADNPVNPNLSNQEGLPAAPFRTDE